eukprot:TRINITY_DN68121_c2_g1_i2.p1 TRINITY_DN68121_c2_g1~~TRINITY_DN68121_c2_g1_i2.p1  ORF type:complete len:221 (-),score=8.29 TRINITY_DN68121_c2_g1_i2:125-787(-)
MQNDSTSSLNEAISFVLHHPRAKGIFPTASGLGLSFDSDTSLEKTQLHHNHTTSAPVQPHPHHTHRSSRPPTAPGSVISQQSYTHPTAPSVSSRHSNKTSPIQPPQVPIVGKSRSQSATNASSATSTTSGGTRTTAASYLQHSQQSANADHEYIKKLETQIQTLPNEQKVSHQPTSFWLIPTFLVFIPCDTLTGTWDSRAQVRVTRVTLNGSSKFVMYSR